MNRVLAILVAFGPFPSAGGEPGGAGPAPITSTDSIRLVERGAILVEDFDAPRLDLTRWRVWQNNPDRTTVGQEGGRLHITAQGPIAMEGLWGLTTAKYKDVVLVGQMDIRSQGPAPHRLALHLCGGDGARSPDHWVEILMVDLGARARFFPSVALPAGMERPVDQFLELPHPPDEGFVCRLTLNGGTNLTELEVKTPDGWRRVCDPIDLPLRTVHTEVKLHRQQGPARGEETVSRAWFDNVRIYPRPESHHVGIRLVRADGSPVWQRAGGAWPPKITDPQGRLRSIEQIEVQLCESDGSVVSSVRSAHMGFYLLPLKDAPWDVYPAAAQVRVLLDGERLGDPLEIECRGLDGLYPDDVYDAVMR